jgi:quinol monooxygenase YgiN
MSISLVLSGVGAVLAAAGVSLLVVRCLRAPRGDLISWSVALFGLLVALGAQALGHLMGFSQLSFRAMEVGAQLIAPLALIMGLAEVVGTTLTARFLARLFIPALGFVALVILGTDPLSGVAFTKAWPEPTTYYQLIPNKLVEYGLAPLSLIVAVAAVGFALARSRHSREWRAAALPVTAAGVAVVALAIPGLSAQLSKYLGLTLPLRSLFALLCLAAAALTWYAGVAVARVPIAALHGGGSGGGGGGDGGGYDGYGDPDDDDLDRDRWNRAAQWQGGDRTGDFESFDDGSQGVYRGGGLYRDEPPPARNGSSAAAQDDPEYGWQNRSGGYPAAAYPGHGADGDYDSRELDGAYDPGYNTGDHDAVYEAGARDSGFGAEGLPPEPAGGFPAPAVAPAFGTSRSAEPGGYPLSSGPAGRPEVTREQLFGQIAIYTLIEDRVHEFDRLTERVVRKVRTNEPDTLVFIVHAVPSAPMQRILYEVYRDRAAFDWHRQQSYVTDFEADRRPFVLATNVIELGLQQAKVSPFPSISDLFGEPGYDTSGFERPDYTREYGSSAGQRGTGP